MISLTNIGKQLTGFIREYSPLTVEEMCPITLAILCYRFTTYDIAEATAGERDDWEQLLMKMDSGNVEPKAWLQTVLLNSADLYRDREEMFDLYDRVTQVMYRLPKGEFCTHYVMLIGECSKDYCSIVLRSVLFNYILRTHGSRLLELVPYEVRRLMSLIVQRTIRGREDLRLYDPFCGVGSLALSVMKHNKGAIRDAVLKDAATLQTDMARLNLIVNGLDGFELRNEDFLNDEWVLRERYDVIASMPAWSLRRRIEPIKLGELPSRYPEFGELPYDYAVIIRALESLKENGMMVLAMPIGVLSQTGIGEDVRLRIIAHRDLRAVIEMPVNLLYSTSVAFALLVFQHNERREDVMMINAKSLFEKQGRLNRMSLVNVGQIARCYATGREEVGLARRVSYGEIANHLYNLLPSQYVNDRRLEQRALEEKVQKINELTEKMKELTREHNAYLRQLGLPELEV